MDGERGSGGAQEGHERVSVCCEKRGPWGEGAEGWDASLGEWSAPAEEGERGARRTLCESRRGWRRRRRREGERVRERRRERGGGRASAPAKRPWRRCELRFAPKLRGRQSSSTFRSVSLACASVCSNSESNLPAQGLARAAAGHGRRARPLEDRASRCCALASTSAAADRRSERAQKQPNQQSVPAAKQRRAGRAWSSVGRTSSCARRARERRLVRFLDQVSPFRLFLLPPS